MAGKPLDIGHNLGMRQIPNLGPNPALAELLRQDGQLDAILDGRGLLFEPATGDDPPPSPPPFRIPRPDWQQELAEREQRQEPAQ